jgi:hypothetical protein
MSAGRVVFDDVPSAQTNSIARQLDGLEAGNVMDADRVPVPDGALIAAA